MINFESNEGSEMGTEDHDTLIRIETKLTKGLQELMDLNSRVRVLETGYWKVVGGVAGIVVIGDLFIKLVIK